MSQVVQGYQLRWKDFSVIGGVTCILVVWATIAPFVYPFSRIMVRLCGLFMICAILDSAKKLNNLIVTLKWFGTYSLELYILHLLLFQPFKNTGIDTLYLITGSISLSIILCRPVHVIINKIVTIWK